MGVVISAEANQRLAELSKQSVLTLLHDSVVFLFLGGSLETLPRKLTTEKVLRCISSGSI